MRTAIVVLLLSVAGFAQTAKVIELSPQDAYKARQLAENLKAAQKSVDDFHAEVSTAYVCMKHSTKLTAILQFAPTYVCPEGYYEKAGWDSGFEFSEDYKFIVSKAPATTTSGTWSFDATPIRGIPHCDGNLCW